MKFFVNTVLRIKNPVLLMMILSKFPYINSQISWSVSGVSEMKQCTYPQKGKRIQNFVKRKLHIFCSSSSGVSFE